MFAFLWVCVEQVSQVDQVRREPLGCQGLRENLVKRVSLVSNSIIDCHCHVSDVFMFVSILAALCKNYTTKFPLKFMEEP